MVFKSGLWLLKISGVLIVAILFFFFFFLSLVEIPDLVNPTQTGKFFVFSLGILACLIFSIPYLFNHCTIAINKIDLVLVILIIFITINRYFIQDDYNFSINYYELLGLALLYVILRQLSEKLLFYLFVAVIVGGLIQCAYGQLQLLEVFQSKHSLFKITGSFFNPGPYAGYISSAFPIALGFYTYRHDLVKPLVDKNYLFIAITYLALITTLFTLLVIVATQSRASWLAILSGSLFLLTYRCSLSSTVRSLTKTRLQRIITWLTIGSICILVFGLLLFLKKDSASGRLLIWKVSSRLIVENPFFGVGFDRFQSFYMGEQAEYFKDGLNINEVKVADNVTYAFNEVLQFVVENGVSGFLILLLLLYLVFSPSVAKAGKTEKNRLIVIGVGVLLAIGSFSLFSYPSQILPIKVNLVLSVATISQLFTSEIKVRYGQVIYRKLMAILMSIIIGFGSIITCVSLNKMYLSFREWDEAIAIYDLGNASESIRSYRSAYLFFKKEGDFLTRYGKALSVAGRHGEASIILNQAIKYQNSIIAQTAYGDSNKATGNFSEAESAYTNAWYMVPSRLYPQYLLAKLHLETKERKKAVSAANIVLKATAKVESEAVEEMKSEMRRIVNGN